MPLAAPRFCPMPGCPELTKGERCEAHRRALYAVNDAGRGSPAQRGYDRAWRRVRALKLSIDPLCELRTHCPKFSFGSQIATEVDHILTIRERPDLRLVFSNLRSACRSCHSARTMKDSVASKGGGSTSPVPSTDYRRSPKFYAVAGFDGGVSRSAGNDF